MLKSSKRSQIWIETVIYTLIALTIIGVILGIVKPVISEKQSELVIHQSIDMLNNIDSGVNEVKYTSGNTRHVPIKITQGKLIINSLANKIEFVLDNSEHEYSEEGVNIMEGDINVTTVKKGKLYQINLTLDYSNRFNVSYQGQEILKTFQPSPNEYSLRVTNLGGNPVNLDFF